MDFFKSLSKFRQAVNNFGKSVPDAAGDMETINSKNEEILKGLNALSTEMNAQSAFQNSDLENNIRLMKEGRGI